MKNLTKLKKSNNLWFKAKQYGWGWYPVTWQGWVVTALYIFSIFTFLEDINTKSVSFSNTFIGMLIPFTILTSILIYICYLKGEKPKWRWG